MGSLVNKGPKELMGLRYSDDTVAGIDKRISCNINRKVTIVVEFLLVGSSILEILVEMLVFRSGIGRSSLVIHVKVIEGQSSLVVVSLFKAGRRGVGRSLTIDCR